VSLFFVDTLAKRFFFCSTLSFQSVNTRFLITRKLPINSKPSHKLVFVLRSLPFIFDFDFVRNPPTFRSQTGILTIYSSCYSIP